MLRHWFLTAGVLFFSHTVNAGSLELGGVSLGAPLSTVEESLRKVNSDFEIKPFIFKEKIIGYQADVKTKLTSGGTNLDSIIALADEDSPRIWVVGRSVRLWNGEEYTLDAFMDTVKQKYGPPSQITTDTKRLEADWSFPINGPLYSGAVRFGPCRSGEVLTDPVRASSGTFIIPTSVHSGCKTSISMQSVRNKAGLISRYYIVLMDEQARFNYVKARLASEVNDQQKAIQDVIAKGAKPKL